MLAWILFGTSSWSSVWRNLYIALRNVIQAPWIYLKKVSWRWRRYRVSWHTCPGCNKRLNDTQAGITIGSNGVMHNSCYDSYCQAGRHQDAIDEDCQRGAK